MTHASFRFAVDRFGIKVFDNCLIAVDEFHHVSANPENRLGTYLTELIARGKVHLVAMTGSYFRDSTRLLHLTDSSSKAPCDGFPFCSLRI